MTVRHAWIALVSLLVVPPTAVRGGPAVNEAARQIPVACRADVVVVGGSSGAVAAAVAAARSGAKVFLAAGHPYLGDDIAGTLRLWLEPGEKPTSPLGQQLFSDPKRDGTGPDPNRLPFSYQASLPSAGVHKDTDPPARLSDGQWGNSSHQSVQYDGSVEIIADLHTPQPIEGLRVVYYERLSDTAGGSFKIDSITIASSDDQRSWQPAAVLHATDDQDKQDLHLGDCFALLAPLKIQARYVKLAIKKADDTQRILLGEIEILGPAKAAPATAAYPPARPLHVKKTLDDALLAAGVEFLYGCYATDVLRDGQGNLCGIVMANRAGRQAVVAKVIVDATDRALVARLAGAKFRPYPVGLHTFKRVVIGGEPRAEVGLTVRTITPSFKGQAPVRKGDSKVRDASARVEYPIYEYTLPIPMKDAGWASWAEAEQQARAMTYQAEQQFTSDELFEVPPDAMHAKNPATGPWQGADALPLEAFRPAGVPHLVVLGGCADISRAQAEKLLRPLALVDLGTRIGESVAEEAKALPVPVGPRLPATAQAGLAVGEVREPLAGVRSVQQAATIPAEARALPILGTYDVVVVGGGTAGAPAGIAAARQGAQTLVVEYLHNLGGVGTVGAISGYCAGNRVGFTSTVLDDPQSKPWLIEQKCEWWRSKIRESKADLWCGVIGCGALVDDGRITGVVVATPQGRGVVQARAVVDATGNADVAAAAGAACLFTQTEDFGMQGTGLPPRQLGSSYTNTDFTITDDTDIVDVWHVLVFAKYKYPAAFDQGQLIDTRERRCIVGETTINVLDEVTGRTYPDTVVQTRGGSYDTHGYTVDPYLYFTHPHTSKLIVNVPYRSLLPKGLEGILVAGLGISAQRDAIPLIRMQPDIQNGGYAAGAAAAMAAKAGTLVRHIDVRALQQHLVDMGNLTASVLTDKDSFPLPADKIAEAVKDLNNHAASAAIVFAQPRESLPLLRQAYPAAQGEDKLGYAVALAMLGDATGVDAIVEQVRATDAWDKGWNYKGMGQFGNAMSVLDCQLVALGRAGDRRAVPVILEKLKLLSAEKEFSHHRAVALALELLHDPAAAAPLAELLAQPGMSGHVQTTIAAAIEQETPGGTNAEQTRRESIRELQLARALYRCGDHEGLGEKILRSYLDDLRGHLARHAQAVLKAGKKAGP